MAEIKQQKEIRVIESEVEAVRKLPDVYIGAAGSIGFKNMLREVVQNSLDEIIKGNTLDKNIIVSYDERNHNTIVEDQGQGIDISMMSVVFSKLHSSSNYDKEAGSGEYSSGKNGQGVKITNFLSKFFNVNSYRMDGKAKRVEFVEGVLVKEKNIKCPKGKHGLLTEFCPSDMMGNISVNGEEIGNLLWQMCNLCLPGTTIKYNWIDIMGQEHSVVYKNTIGIVEILNSICNKTNIVPIYFIEDNGTTKVEVLFSYDTKIMDETYILSFANMCPTSGGTHVDGFLDAIIKFFRDYMNKIYLANNKKLQVNSSDIRTGLRAVVSCYHIFPLFTGQSKEYFSKEDMKPFVYNVTLKALNEWAQNNPTDLQKTCKYLKDICEIRMKSEGEKIKLSDKYNASVISGMPSKFKKPNSKGPFELWIAEGDSAISGMENNRDKATQGIFPIRGKLSNAFTTPTKKFFENEEISSLLKIFGYQNYSKKLDPEKFKPEKVVIATDADADGSHIECLVAMFFLRYLPFVIEQGKLYAANPPLYGMKTKNGHVFFADNYEYIEYVQTLFCKNNSIHNIKNKPMTKKEIVKILYNNIDYTKYMDHVSRIFSVDPNMLEFVLFHIDSIKNFNKFKKIIEKEYKFVKVNNTNNVIIIRGLVGSNYQTLFCNQQLIEYSKPILDLINRSDNYYIVNKHKISLYNLLTMFNSYSPNITRYKGLGEMKPALLGQSTVIPGMGRTLKQYTIDDVMKQTNWVKEMQNDKSAFLKNVNIIRKEDII